MKLLCISVILAVALSCSEKKNKDVSVEGKTERKTIKFENLEIINSVEPSDFKKHLSSEINDFILKMLKDKEFELIKKFKYRDKTGHFIYVTAKNNNDEIGFRIAEYYIRVNDSKLENSYFMPISPKQVARLKALLKKQ